MQRDFTRTDAKAQACSYILLSLLQRMDRQESGLIDDLLAGATGEFERFGGEMFLEELGAQEFFVGGRGKPLTPKGARE